METDKVQVRRGLPGDFNFIISTWLRSFKHASYFAKRIQNAIFYRFHHNLCTRLLARSQVFVACDRVDPNVIYGWLVTEKFEGNDVVHYVYVKAPFRRMGIAATLLVGASVDPNTLVFSHWSYAVDKLLIKYPKMVYVPYLV